MALVNRKPHGTPGHDDVNNPQDVAWLAALKYAQKKVFIQTPTFTATPIVQGVLETVRRGIEVILFVDVGFNDGGEALPFQGGTNEEVAKRLFAALKTDEEKSRLKYYWYTAKDQEKPVNAHINHRNCHVKLMVVDDHLGIQGNGNQVSRRQCVYFGRERERTLADFTCFVYLLYPGRTKLVPLARDQRHARLSSNLCRLDGPDQKKPEHTLGGPT